MLLINGVSVAREVDGKHNVTEVRERDGEGKVKVRKEKHKKD